MSNRQYPLTDRLRGKVDETTLRELEAIERTAGAKFVHAASNGVVRRWWDIGSKVVTIAAFIWFVSAKWTTFERDMEWVKQAVATRPSTAGLEDEIASLRTDVASVKAQVSELAETTDGNRITTTRILSDMRRRISAIESSLSGVGR